jgi:galactose mutarotase-like enzyme
MRHYPYRRNADCRLLLDQTWCGYHAVTLQNRLIRVTVLPEKGGEIIEWLHKPTDTDVLFLSPNGLRRGQHAEPSIGGAPGTFVDRYAGAWQEILPAGGPPASFGGAEFGQHGEISVLPWRCELLTDNDKEVAVKLTVQTIRTPLLLERIMRLTADQPILFVEESLTNLAPQPLPVMWGHHPAYGGAFLDDSCIFKIKQARIEVPEELAFPTQRLAPGTTADWPKVQGRDGQTVDLSTMPPRTANTADYFYLTDLAEGRYRIVSQRLGLAVDMRWDLSIMPHLWFWQVAGGAPDYPWWSQTYSMALEPFASKCCNYQQAATTNDALLLASNETRTFTLQAAIIRVD